MLIRESGFTFGGKHCYLDYGCLYAEKDGHPLTAQVKRNEYAISGQSGTVLLPGDHRETLTFEGKLYPAAEAPTQMEAQARLREIARWLGSGRQRLIFDYEPQVYYMAQVDEETRWSLERWFGGELVVKFIAQPNAYNVTASSASTLGTETWTSLQMQVDTVLPAPVNLTLANEGSAPVTGVTLVADQVAKVSINGITMIRGGVLIIRMEPPMGAELNGQSALPYAAKFDPLLLPGGWRQVMVGLTWGSGERSVRIDAMARGRQ